jgi:hypothetical protein
MDLFYQSGGGIYLFNETNKIRFSINLDAIQRANLIVSSKLLHLSSSIKKK